MESPKKPEGFKKRGNLSEPYKLTDLPEGFENLEINSPTVLNNNYHKHLQD